jgi:two-component system alkaline phosphatase synthesis response regulator PhoP
VNNNLKKVLIVDDEPSIREVYQEVLGPFYEVHTADNGNTALELCQKIAPDIIVSDFDMPEMNGINFCRAIRSDKRFTQVPFLILSSHTTETLRTESFNIGADDYISKPVSLPELRARIEAKLRWLGNTGPKTEIKSNDTLECGNLIINHRRAEVYIDTEKIDLTSFEIKLITYLIENKEKKLKRDDILMDVWAAHIVSGRTVDAHICALRQKLNAFDHKIETVRGYGYTLVNTKGSARTDRN